MRALLDRLLSAALAVAALAIAGALIHREFFSGSNPASGVESKYVSNWREIAKVGRAVGDPNARVTLVEFSDFQCPFCRRFNGTLRRTLEAFPTQVSYVFIHYPLPNHPFALPAARAAECANAHGKFHVIADRMFDTQDSLGKRPWSSYALDAGISDTSGFVKCMGDSVATSLVDAGLRTGNDLGIRGTPTILLNGWEYGTPPTDSELTRAIGDILAGRRPYRGFPKDETRRPSLTATRDLP